MTFSAIPVAAISVALVACCFSLYADFPRNLAFSILSPQKTTVRQVPNFVPIVHDSAKNITYIGSSVDGVEHYQNIFYAEDTSGKNRFAPPLPYLPAPGSTVDATKVGAWCPQNIGDILPFTSRVENVSENCLSLRVSRAHGTSQNSKLPVVVWMHGGGHALGSTSDQFYRPDGLLNQASEDSQSVIYVGINYRVGIFGFATSQALVDAQQTNAGLKDQRAAFEWVRGNIAAFGGDPQNVTAIGQSVGGVDIGLQLTSYGGTRGVPFQKAIMMSGAPGMMFNIKSDFVRNNTAKVAAGVDCVRNENSQSAGTLECLRKAPLEKLMNLSVSMSRSARPPFGEGFFGPTYDGDFIPDRPSLLTRAGKVVKGIPIIASWVTNEGAWYAPPTTSTDEEVTNNLGLWLFNLSPSAKSELLRLYPLNDFKHMARPDYDGPISPQYYRAAQLNRDFWFTCPMLDFVWQYAKHGASGEPPSVRLYEHNATRFTPVFEKMSVPMWRVAHLSDIPYLFNGEVEAGGDNSEPQRALARKLSSSLVKFANDAEPAGARSGVDEWPAAFGNPAEADLEGEFLSAIALELFGGPYGTGPVTVRKRMLTNGVSAKDQAVLDEKLFERCEFINSEKVRGETGV